MRRELIGVVGVDSGQLMICDPCYIDSNWERQEFDPDTPKWRREAEGLGYNHVCRVTSQKPGGGIPYLLGHDGLAVAFRSGYGDGIYEVYAHIAENEETDGWGERVAKVEIILIPELFED